MPSPLLQQRASDLGIEIHFQTDISDLPRFADADLIVASDGINSFVRDGNKTHFGTEVDLRPNRFTTATA